MPPSRENRPPLLWAGCGVGSWNRLLARNRFAVDRSRWPAAAVVTAASAFNSALGLAQSFAHGDRISSTTVRHAPVFVLGHWRSGTTLLHELLAADPRHAAPTTWDCLAPHHFLLTRGWLPRLLGWLVPGRRPMDNMPAGWDRPQEDEFALALLGQPSPYERIAFPDRETAGAGALDLLGLPPGARCRWERTFYRLVQTLTRAHGGRRLMLKSPPHTARVPVLLKLFPDSRFVHLVRDPYAVYPSTLYLWRHLTAAHALGRPAWDRLPEWIVETYRTLFARLDEARPLIPPGRFHELRYEDLIADPVTELRAIYRCLDLGDFNSARPAVEAYLAGQRGYEQNRYILTPAERRTVTDRWGEIVRRYGYALQAD